MRENVFPLFFLLVFVLAIMFIRFIWKILPVYWVLKITQFLGKFLCFRSKRTVADENGYIHFWDLMQLGHPLRKEAAAYNDGRII